jgi:eukaryotic-like serine/threonine-protein kinase
MIGQTVSRYRVIEELGRGGMGVVYRAEDSELRRQVALKFISDDASNDVAVQRFLREARATAALNHPHICTVFEVGEHEGRRFIAMELLEGATVKRLIADHALPLSQVAPVGVQVAAALAAAHAKGIIHRDIKPANVFVGPGQRVKILDFGIAKLQSTDTGEPTATDLTRESASPGTLPYMAPEQVRGDHVDARTDVWAVGCLLYEMATGQRPFPEEVSGRLRDAILHAAPAAPRRVNSEIPGRLEAIVLKCLEKEAARRYQSADDLAADLHGLAGHDMGARAWRTAIRMRSPPALAGLGLAVALALAAAVAMRPGGVRMLLSRHAGVAQARVKSLAVLPLENFSGDADQQYLADGMTEALITELARISSLRVISRSSVMRYKAGRKPLGEIARELGVDAVVEGSVTRAGGRVHVTAQLINASDERHLWAESYDRDLADALVLQRDVAQACARQIQVKLSPGDQSRLARTRRLNPAAYEAYLKGMFHLNTLTPEGRQKGLALLQQAVDADPFDPMAWGGLARGYCAIGHGVTGDREAFAKGREAALKALKLDDTLPEAHAALAEIKLYEEWDWPGAEREFRRALELSPSLAAAHAHYSWYLLLFGRFDEAIAAGRRAQEADPLTPLWTAWQAWLYAYADRMPEALSEARKSLDLNPAFPLGHHVTGVVLDELRRHDEAIAAHGRAAAGNALFRGGLAVSYAIASRRTEALAIAAEMEAAPQPDNWNLALIYANLGDEDRAFRWLEDAYRKRRDVTPWAVRAPILRSLRGDPRMDDLRRRLNLPVIG